MHVNFFRFITLLAFILITGCAASYKPIMPAQRVYRTGDSTSVIGMMYKYDVLSLRKNRRYSKKEMKAMLSVVAVKIHNHSDSVLFTSKMKLFAGTREVIPVSPILAAKALRQGVAIYLLYSLLTFTLTKQEFTGHGVENHYTVLPIGIPIAIGNMIGAADANAHLKREFMKYDISNKSIKPGETLYGIITLMGASHDPLNVKFY